MLDKDPSRNTSHIDRRQDVLEGALLRGSITRRAFVTMSLALGFLSASRIGALAQTLDEIKTNQAARAKALSGSYDYVVCGAGTAACALVGRLALDSSKSILLIEAGGWDDAPSILNPSIWFTNIGTERAWSDVTPPFAGINNRSILEQTGRVLGGGSSINAACWVRPFKDDFEFWANEAKDERWGYEHALSIYRRVENWRGTPDDRYRGKDGPVWCQPAKDPSPVAPAMLEACRALGLPVIEDSNGKREETGEGFAYFNHIVRDGQRQNMAKSYLYPVLNKKNVTLLVDTQVDRLLIKNGKVSGVEFVRDGNRQIVAAEHEVIVCGGGINTPRLLMLSGIGDEKHLRSVGIEPVVHSPEVGKNFQDHILHRGCLWEAQKKVELRNSGAEVLGYLKSDPSLNRPDISVVQVESPITTEVISKKYSRHQRAGRSVQL
ncbi:GMC family oxidoreductase [Bradyrhizobium sp. CCBAU 53340]|uniref:GMC family oxidoreductase n=1 Tax=Bradyrhizobium sp. CCBAU 53340 TaxID=1325112 RepID=UPI001AEECF96|nr:GMC family oxidoreductase N-terminal domain-containing protein [Bradyrhizobium sp. CCBAU 53340]